MEILYFVLAAINLVAVVVTGILWTLLDPGYHPTLRLHLRDIRAVHFGSQFNYQFSLYGVPETRGTITPLLLTFDGTDYTPVAFGDPITFTGPTGFISVPFGGSSSSRSLVPAQGMPYWRSS